MTIARIVITAVVAAGATVLAQFVLAGHVNIFAAPLGAAAGSLAGTLLRR